MTRSAFKLLALGGFSAAAIGGTVGATIERPATQKPVVTVYKSPT